MLVLITGVALVLRWQANRKLTVAKADVQAVVDEEMWALKTGNWDLYASLLDRQAPSFWYREQHGLFIQNSQRGTFSATVIDLVLLQPELALVELEIKPPGRSAYRETRAYRRVDGRWRQTVAPAGELWVHPVRRETANLRFTYHRDDAERLEPLFPALQALYAQLLKDFSLAPLPGKRHLQIVLSVLPADEAFADTSLRYDLSSLAASSDPQQLQRELGRQLTDRVLRQFYERAGDMAFVLDGIREWEVSAWMGAPDPEAEARIVRVLVEKPFVPLSMVRPEQFDSPTLAALTATVVDYLVQRKGRGAVGSLIFGLERYGEWETLIEKAVGLPYADVVDGWWEFVAQRYAPFSASAPEPDAVLAQLKWMLELERQAVNTHDFQLFESLVDLVAPSQWLRNEWDRRLGNRRGGFTPDPTQIDVWGYKDHGAWVVLRPRPHPNAQSGYFPPEVHFYRFAHRRWYLTTPEIAFPNPHIVRLADLVKGLREHPDLRELITAVFSVDPATFETGWRMYLERTYGKRE